MVERKAQLFQVLILIMALALVGVHALAWEGGHEELFLTYLALTSLASLLRLGVPSTSGTISISFVFVLASLAQLNLPQAIAIGVAGTVLHQSLGRRGRWLDLGYQAAVLVLGIEAASRAYRHAAEWLPEAGLLGGLAVAAVAMFVMMAFPLAASAALAEGQPLSRVWRHRYMWSLPYYLAGAALAGLLCAISARPFWQVALLMLPLLLMVYRSYGLQLDALDRERTHSDELAALQLNLIEALALAVESKELTAVDQLHRMTVYALGLGRECGLKDQQLRALRAAAVLHDIGQVAVPDHIIMKPGKLTPEEYERLKVHPEIGAEIIERAKFPYPVAPIVRAHHERWDGSGYPSGLKKEQIPLEARVLSAVDMLVALSSDRSYRRAEPLDKAMEKVRAEAGKTLDPAVVERLDALYRALEEQAQASRRHNADPGAADSSAQPAFLTKIAAARNEEQSLLEFTQILGSSLNLDETLNALARRIRQHIAFDTMVVYLKDPGEARLTVIFVEGENFSLFNGLTLGPSDGASSSLLDSKKALLNADPATEPLAGRDPAKAARLHSVLAVPLMGTYGLMGVMSFYSERRQAFSQANLSLLSSLSGKLALTIGNLLRHKEAEAQATNDFLTGLPNAGSLFMHLQGELARCARSGGTLAVLVCDLDGFKAVNDRFGHLTGNKLLQAVSAGLKDLCREYDFVARLGGDEFVVVLPGATDEAVKLRRRRFAEMVERCGVEETGEQVVGMSSGIAFYPKDGHVAEELLSTADERMYADKSARKAMKLGAGLNTAHSWLNQ